MPLDRKFRLARMWSNQELERISPAFGGHVVNVSAWQDSDKVGRKYQDYFPNASQYSITNYGGFRGHQGQVGEYELDLTAPLPDELRGHFDVVFNHTTLEHIFDTRMAFANLCAMSRDAVIVIVPFSQIQHETESWKDFWRFTPTCMRVLFAENDFEVTYESANGDRNAALYLLFAGARSAASWRGKLPAWEPIDRAGVLIGDSPTATLYQNLRSAVGRILRPGRRRASAASDTPDASDAFHE